jgi:hypothetical protein
MCEKPYGLSAMQENDAHAGVLELFQERIVAQEVDLAAGPAEAFAAVGTEIRMSASRGLRTSERRDVDRELFALRPARYGMT